MKIIDVEQGSPEWHQARKGLPTASNFHRIMTPAKREYSAQAKGYMIELLAEKLAYEAPKSLDHLPSIERGKMLEPRAVAAYEMMFGVTAQAVGLVTTDDGRFGASPDRLVPGGGLEVKCPESPTHLSYWFDGFGSDYKCQRMGQMYVAELDFVDMWSFHPLLPEVHVRVPRDDSFIADLAVNLNRFAEEMAVFEERLLSTGYFQEFAEAAE